MTDHNNKKQPKPDPKTHFFLKNCLCMTGERAPTHELSPLELVIGTLGIIPLWVKGTVLRYRFNQTSAVALKELGRTKEEILRLFNKAVGKWGVAAPVKFLEDNVAWDFEFDVRKDTFCFDGGCVLASAFFPDTGRHQFVIYPSMFDHNEPEQVETLVHELGHIFGLRHWFAKMEDGDGWHSEVFGRNSPISIMNYDDETTLTDESTLTDADKTDLIRLYNMAWSGRLTRIKKTPIELFESFSSRIARTSAPTP
ncbi:MAG: peptidase M10A and M12B matrixin and adamalysin [Linnemannia elongata]|nr:MAG: peptidase M10A and M12B matrixin and adamalysin [Linnemannia elongata]